MTFSTNPDHEMDIIGTSASKASAVKMRHEAIKTLPIVDVAGLRSGDYAVRSCVGSAIRAACLDKGFFYCTGHGVDPALIKTVFERSSQFFALPEEQKLALDLALSDANRGYEPLKRQTLEVGMPPDLKEGYYIGMHVDAEDERSKRQFNTGPNVWPDGVPGFQDAMLIYYGEMLTLSHLLLEGIALSLGLSTSFFDGLCQDPIATLRLLHYPPQPANPQPGEKGCGAHTDFGGITILLQDDVGGLQVWDHDNSNWIDGTPVPGAFVVNLGDLIARWTNDRYRSTIHRVINQSGRERYSVPFFFAGNPDHLVTCIETCLDEQGQSKYQPVTVDTHMRECYARSYGTGI